MARNVIPSNRELAEHSLAQARAYKATSPAERAGKARAIEQLQRYLAALDAADEQEEGEA